MNKPILNIGFWFKRKFHKKQRPIHLLGRGGMAYCDGVNEYYLDTDNMLPPGTPMVIYYQDIKLLDGSRSLTDEEKKIVAEKVKAILENKGSKIVITTRQSDLGTSKYNDS